MKRKLKIILLPLLVLLAITSCRQYEKVKSKEFGLEIKTGGIPGDTWFEAFMYNTDILGYAERYRINKTRLDENTLYVLRHNFKDTIEFTDTFKVVFKDSELDSLYSLTYEYLSTVNMSNEIEEFNGKLREVVTHGAYFSVSLLYGNKRLQCSEWSLKDVSHSSKRAEQLFTFINKKLPEEFQLY